MIRIFQGIWIQLEEIVNYRKEIKLEMSGAILLAIRLFYIADCNTQMMKIDNIELLFNNTLIIAY